MLGPFLFLIHINSLLVGLQRECDLFADDTSLIAVVHGINISQNDLTVTCKKCECTNSKGNSIPILVNKFKK